MSSTVVFGKQVQTGARGHNRRRVRHQEPQHPKQQCEDINLGHGRARKLQEHHKVLLSVCHRSSSRIWHHTERDLLEHREMAAGHEAVVSHGHRNRVGGQQMRPNSKPRHHLRRGTGFGENARLAFHRDLSKDRRKRWELLHNDRVGAIWKNWILQARSKRDSGHKGRVLVQRSGCDRCGQTG